VDLDAFVATHADEWQRLDRLSRRGSLSPDEVDELVSLYQRAATHLSQVRSASPDPTLVARLSLVVNRARQRVTGVHEPAHREIARFFLASFPAALYRLRWLTLAVTVAFVAVGWAAGAWVAGSDEVRSSMLTDSEVRRLCEVDFAAYYSSNPAGAFAAQVWTNNAWIAAISIAFGITGVFPLYVFAQNAFNVGIVGGFMASCDRLDLFFGLITPHGLLELTAVFVALAAGLRLFWAWIDPGPRPRLDSLATEGRALFGVALGLVPVLLLSGIVEAFVTPSPLPTWARIAVGVLVWAAFAAYALVLGRRAARAGHTGDIRREFAGEVQPVAG
jgi:uncharacterized membrane protein SpoIIM required for sporulation